LGERGFRDGGRGGVAVAVGREVGDPEERVLGS
jgi:hypothetical protein